MDSVSELERTRGGAVVVRRAERGDAQALWALVQEFAAYEKLEHLVTGSAERLAANLFGGAWPALEGFVAAAGPDLVGFAIFGGGYSTFWTRPLIWLEDIFVTAPYRGRGIGRRLMSAVARVAIERGCPRMDWSVLDWNTPSIEFYERLGAERQESWHTYQLGGERLRALAEERSTTPRGEGPTSSVT